MLMMMMFMNLFFSSFWKSGINFLFLSFLMMNFPLNSYLGSLSMNMGYDILGFMMIYLTILVFFFSCLSSKNYFKNNFLLVMIYILFKILFFTFSLSNLMLFYIFFELSLIPMMIIILGWGMKVERMQAGMYFLFYTMFSSLPLLICLILYFYMCFSSFMFLMNSLKWGFFFVICFLFGFLVKLPIFMFHLWLPKAHVEAPVMGSMILAGILLKLGGYGIIRIMNVLYEYMYCVCSFFISFSIWGGLLISISCLNQMDLKMIVAFSSVSHMSLLIGGIFSGYNLGLYGSFLMMISHGITSSGMFYLVNVLYERTKSRSLIKNKGIINISPNLSMCSFLIISASMGTPPSINLLSEIFLFYTVMFWFKMFFITMFFMLLISVCYSMYMYSFSQHGKMFNGIYFFKKIFVIEYFVILMHWIPSNLLILKSSMFFFM